MTIMLSSGSVALAQDQWLANWNVSIKGGFGGTGIVKTTMYEDEAVELSRSEGPAVIAIGIETPITDRWTFALEHHRGFRLGPFSTGVGFTHAFWRWSYPRAFPAMIRPSQEEFMFNRDWTGFVGGGVGLAMGSIEREGDLIPRIEASGLTLGLTLGVDYPYRTDMLIRSELIVASTIMSSGTLPGSLSEFLLSCGIVFPY